LEFSADDDRGSSYIGNVGAFSSGDGTIEKFTVEFRTRLDPSVRRLTLTFTGAADQVTIDLELGPASGENRGLRGTSPPERAAELVGQAARFSAGRIQETAGQRPAITT
jgi:hypothetical protein